MCYRCTEDQQTFMGNDEKPLSSPKLPTPLHGYQDMGADQPMADRLAKALSLLVSSRPYGDTVLP